MIIGVVLMVPGTISTIAVLGVRQPRLTQLVASGHAATVALLGLAIVGAVVLAIGMILDVMIPAFSPTLAREYYGSFWTVIASFGTAVLVANLLTLPYVLVEAARQPGVPITLTPGGLVLSVLTLDGCLVGVVFLRIIHPHVLSWQDLGLTLANFWNMVRLGGGVGVVVILGSAALEAALRAVGIQQTQEQMFTGIVGAPLGQFLGVLLAGAVIAPICEEIFFRGFVFTVVWRTHGQVAAFIVSAVLFAIAHLNLQAFVPILFIAVIFAYVYSRTGSLVPSMVAHGMNNALALIALYVSHPH
ncbi:MAG TPA: type II CAAX endopeptidase family protein [Chloroflexota bacterium]|nr:type II CAAX endopeptidase family protein [Chloroflexota bacterium]